MAVPPPSWRPASVAALIDSAGTQASLEHLLRDLAESVPFELASVLAYRGRGRPVHLYDTFRSAAHRRGLENYLRYSYVLNPCYQAYLDGIRPGVYRIRELLARGHPAGAIGDDTPVAVSPTEEIGYVTRGWPQKREELLLIVALGDGAVAEIGLLRSRTLGGFHDEHLRQLRAAEPVAGAVVRRYWQTCSARTEPAPDRRIDEAYDNFGKGSLSERERAVMRMVLRGHSSESIGLHLGISITTVKTHRKNAYAKLGISTQSELLALFVQTLGT
jgi:DNA-binding CsgD family transcriptional regulator